MTEDLEWTRELFDRTRGAGEPGWTADPAALARAGDRRRRFRTVGAGGGLAGVVAVTAAVAVGLGAGTTDPGSQSGPGGAWGNRPLSDVFKYVTYLSAVGQSGQAYVPARAAADLATVMGHVDPSFTHLVGSHDPATGPRIVAAGDERAEQVKSISMSSIWTTDVLRQSGGLNFEFASSSGWAETVQSTEPGADQLAAPCNAAVNAAQSAPGSGSTPSLAVKWSACTTSHLRDGSTIGSASARIGTGTATVVVREFADGELFSVVGQDFQTGWLSAAPDPATVVEPTPWTEQSLVAAMSDSDVRSGWNPLPPPNSDGKLLQPSDLGKSWSYDTAAADQGTSEELMITNGCGTDLNMPLAKSGPDTHYWGPLPNGVSGTADEGEYFLAPGSGAQAMAKARSAAQGGCKLTPVDYSKDTLMPLPAGIGDDAFAESEPDLGTVSVDVRVGDTILRTDLSNANHVRDQSWTDKKPLGLSSPADQRWLAAIARSMVSRYTAGGTHR